MVRRGMHDVEWASCTNKWEEPADGHYRKVMILPGRRA
jgi:hypothetical protein